MMRWVQRFVADLVGVQVDTVRVARALPLVFALVAGWEFLQHVIEVRSGFFVSAAAAKASQFDAGRMASGWAKMVLVYAAGFFATRYLLWRDGRRAMRWDGPAVARYIPYAAYSLALFALVLHAGALVAPAHVTGVRLAVSLVQIAIEPLLFLWVVAAATDGPVRGPVASARAIGAWYGWGLALFFVARLPINAVHQLINHQAIGAPPAWLWTMLALDALVVGLVVTVVPAIAVRVYRLVAIERGRVVQPAG